MLFNSLQFALFFPIVTILYFLLPHKHRWWLLLGASAYFYMMFVPSYILILGATIVIDYVIGIWMEQEASPYRKKVYLIASLVANIGFLVFFKYFNFLNTNISTLAQLIGWNYSIQNLEIILPIGLSFHTFQAMGYTIEVFRGNQKAERHFGIYALYVMFYPQLVAGPIERPENMLPQFREEQFFDYQRVTDGLKLMAWGLFKKVVIADRLASMVNGYYDNPYETSGPFLALATVGFAVQIYCDFSGYSDIAIGAAQVMGIKLMDNFKRPYPALSISEFWRRWHISLSTWLRDYVFFPLHRKLLRRKSHPTWVIQFLPPFVTMLVSGIWHGANWTFVVWGALHGLYLILEMKLKDIWLTISERFRVTLPVWLSHTLMRILVFALVCYAWIFFRASSLPIAFYIATKVFTGWLDGHSVMQLFYSISVNFELLITFAAVVIMEIVHYFQERGSVRLMLAERPAILRWSLYVGVLVSILVFGKIYQAATTFIYFQF